MAARETTSMSLGRAAWIVTVLICVVASVVLIVSGYQGYAALVFAVGPQRGHQPHLSSARSARAARPRWPIAAFSSGATSAIVRPPGRSSGTNAGS